MGSLKDDWLGGRWKMGRSVWAKEDCYGSLACPPPLCSLPTWSSSSGCLQIFFPSPCLCLQGSVVVFSNYAWWTYTDTTSPTYCAHTPMLFAFVLLLVSLTSSLLEVIVCVHVCLTTFKKSELECLIAGEMVADPSPLPHRMHICPLLSKWEWGRGDWKLSPNYIAKLVFE